MGNVKKTGARKSVRRRGHAVTIDGVPVTTQDGEYTRVQGLAIDDFSRERMDRTLAELEEERAGVAHLLG